MLKILITGASGALGSAVAETLALPGHTLILQGRNRHALDELSARCQRSGADVQLDIFDLCDDTARTDWLDKLLQSEPPDLVFANAGMNIHAEPGQYCESWQKMSALLDLNVKATLHLAQAMGEAMARRGQGQLVLISSLAAWYGLPVTPTYSASKAAVKVYGEALRALLAPAGVRVTVVMPGYFESPMCHAMPGPKPWVWTPEKAAATILKRLQRNPPRIGFPFWLNWGCWWLAVLPARLSGYLLKVMGYLPK